MPKERQRGGRKPPLRIDRQFFNYSLHLLSLGESIDKLPKPAPGEPGVRAVLVGRCIRSTVPTDRYDQLTEFKAVQTWLNGVKGDLVLQSMALEISELQVDPGLDWQMLCERSGITATGKPWNKKALNASLRAQGSQVRKALDYLEGPAPASPSATGDRRR